ncbi:hypothetical protein [Tsukamurella tyrosinosolvens]|uniref:hypothetical protein n=1 Tax=Tsukamurella tyrosinosolvens TaxID=57704 RepID=UPI002DD439DA|nr:hypothetical protein [Tsukamurella tyrosinosolvens]MEC4613814.1 hypothetical protein [Tsukamurella tyrosinosolvens]
MTRSISKPQSPREIRASLRRKAHGRFVFIYWIALIVALLIVGIGWMFLPVSVRQDVRPLEVGTWLPHLYDVLAGRISATFALGITTTCLLGVLSINFGLALKPGERRDPDDEREVSDEDYYAANAWRGDMDRGATVLAIVGVLAASAVWFDGDVRRNSGVALGAAMLAMIGAWFASRIAVAKANAAERALRRADRAEALSNVQQRLERLPEESRRVPTATQHWYSTGLAACILRVGLLQGVLAVATGIAGAVVVTTAYGLLVGQWFSPGVVLNAFLIAMLLSLPTAYLAVSTSQHRWQNYATEGTATRSAWTRWTMRGLCLALLVAGSITAAGDPSPSGLSAGQTTAIALYFVISLGLAPVLTWWITWHTARSARPAVASRLMLPFWVSVARALNRRQRQLELRTATDVEPVIAFGQAA